VGNGSRQRRQHLGPCFADAQPPDSVPVEFELGGPLCALGTHRLADATLHDAEQRLIVAPVRDPCSAGPGTGAFDRHPDDLGWRRKRRAHVEHHLDVGTQPLLDLHGRLWGEPVHRSVVRAAKRDAVVVDLRLE
jgi:hypothetical protein